MGVLVSTQVFALTTEFRCNCVKDMPIKLTTTDSPHIIKLEGIDGIQIIDGEKKVVKLGDKTYPFSTPQVKELAMSILKVAKHCYNEHIDTMRRVEE